MESHLKFYICLRETLGEVITLLVIAESEDEARNKCMNSFSDCTGCYYTLEVTEKDFVRYSYHRFSPAEDIYYLCSGKLSIKSLFKERKSE